MTFLSKLIDQLAGLRFSAIDLAIVLLVGFYYLPRFPAIICVLTTLGLLFISGEAQDQLIARIDRE